MTLDFFLLGVGVVLLGGATTAAKHLKARLDVAGDPEAVGLTLALMVCNILQLLGAVILIGGLFG